MGLFSKKYDIHEDRLRIVFNEEEKQYFCYYGPTLISYKELNRKSKKLINSKNKELLTNQNLLKHELELAKAKARFRKLQSLGYTCGSFEHLGEVNGTMSKEIEQLLNKLTSEENILLGIHRIKSSTPDEAIKDILINGLKMTGHRDGAVPNTNSLSNNVSYYPSNKTIIKELMYADTFKNSKGSLLIRIPDEDLQKNIYIIDKEGYPRLNPKYIIGYVPLYDNHHLENIITSNQTNINQNNYTFENKEQSLTYYQEEKQKKAR